MENSFVSGIDAASYDRQLNAMLDFDSTSWIDQIKLPTLVIGTDEDLLADVKDSKFIAEKISGAELVCFKNTGHCAMLEKPNLFNEALKRFLRK